MRESNWDYEKRLKKNYEEMVKTKVTKLPYDKFRERQENANQAQLRKEHQERGSYTIRGS